MAETLREPTVGDRYLHYKGKEVVVLEVRKSRAAKAKGDLTDGAAIAVDPIHKGEKIVIYREEDRYWARPLRTFNEVLGDKDEGTYFYRFSKM